MLLDVQLPVQVLHADVVDIEIMASGDRADAVKDVFRTAGARDRVDHDVSVGQNFAYPGGDRRRDLLRTLERKIAFQPYGNVGKKAVARLPEADSLHLQHAIHSPQPVKDLTAHAGRGGVQQCINGSARQTPTDENPYARHE